MYFATFVGGLLFLLPIFALYLEKELFSITNVAIILSIEAISIAVFEIPTGALADLFGRKKTLILAHITRVLSVLFLYVGGSFLMFILYAIVAGLSMSLSSGTDQALIYDTLKDENKERYYKKIIGMFEAIWAISLSIGAIIGGYFAKFSLSFPVLMTLIPLSIAAISILFLKEPNYEKEDHRNIFRHIKNSFKLTVNSKQLIVLIAGLFVLGALGETMHHLVPLFFKFKEIPVEMFGWITATIFFWSSLGHYFSHNISEKFGNKKILLICVLASPILVLIATFLDKYAAIVLFTFSSFFFGIRRPLINYFINLEVSSSKRATIMSTSNFLCKIGLGIFAPIIGHFADLYSINTAFKISAIAMFSIFVIYIFLQDKKVEHEKFSNEIQSPPSV